jgi:hypothetical protein
MKWAPDKERESCGGTVSGGLSQLNAKARRGDAFASTFRTAPRSRDAAACAKPIAAVLTGCRLEHKAAGVVSRNGQRDMLKMLLDLPLRNGVEMSQISGGIASTAEGLHDLLPKG